MYLKEECQRYCGDIRNENVEGRLKQTENDRARKIEFRFRF